MSTSAGSVLSRRIDPSTLPLAIGDVVVLVVLLSAGTAMHQSVDFLAGISYLAGNPGYLANTLLPFLIGWVLVAPLVGAYSPGAGESAKASVPLAIRSWIPAAILGVGLRAFVPIFHGGASPVFVLVTLVVGAVGLGIWRFLYFRLR